MNSQTSDQMGSSTLDAYREQNRLLLIFAPDEADANYQQQQQMIEGQEVACDERDLLLFHLFASGESDMGGTQSASALPAELRDQFGVEEDEFALVLIGKDGTEKARKSQPTALDEIFGLIDDMPMRQREEKG